LPIHVEGVSNTKIFAQGKYIPVLHDTLMYKRGHLVVFVLGHPDHFSFIVVDQVKNYFEAKLLWFNSRFAETDLELAGTGNNYDVQCVIDQIRSVVKSVDRDSAKGYDFTPEEILVMQDAIPIDGGNCAFHVVLGITRLMDIVNRTRRSRSRKFIRPGLAANMASMKSGYPPGLGQLRRELKSVIAFKQSAAARFAAAAGLPDGRDLSQNFRQTARYFNFGNGP